MNMEDQKILEVRNLNKAYNKFIAVNDLSFTVNKGDIYGFLGPNGAGKSTTIRMILSLIYPDKGDIFLFGNSIKSNRSTIMKNVGAIVEKPDFYTSLTARQNLELLCKMQMMEVPKNRTMEVLEWVGLNERADSKVKTFSQGMKQRLGIAQALMHNPELIILDEPTNGLDPQGMRDIREMILSLNKDHNKTVFLSSHILSEVEILANRMLIINNGTKLIEGEVSTILNTGNQSISIELDKPESAIEIIENSEFKNNLTSIENGKFHFTIEKKKIPQLNKYLVTHNIGVISISTIRTLEEYFLSLT